MFNVYTVHIASNGIKLIEVYAGSEDHAFEAFVMAEGNPQLIDARDRFEVRAA